MGSLKEVTTCSPSFSVMLHILERGVSAYIIWNSSVWGICLFLPIYLFVSVWTHAYSFCALGYPVLIYFSPQIISALTLGSSFSWFLGPFDICPSIWFLLFEVCVCTPVCVEHFVNFRHYGVFQNQRVGYIPQLSPRMSPYFKDLQFFCWRMVLGTKVDLGTDCHSLLIFLQP